MEDGFQVTNAAGLVDRGAIAGEATMIQMPIWRATPRRLWLRYLTNWICPEHRWWWMPFGKPASIGLGFIAAHVRSTHVHIIVAGLANPDRAINDFKSYSSRALNQYGFETADRRRWARGGSTRQLSSGDAVREAVGYVVDGQGDPMVVYQTELEPFLRQ